MRIVVTGATGFLGGHVVVALLARGHRVRAMGRDEAKLTRLAEAGAQPSRTDLRDRDAVIAACRDQDVVVHCGALSAPWGKRQDFDDANVRGTANVLAARVPRLIHISSPAVVFPDRDVVNATEEAPYPARYSSLYAASKRAAEDLVRASLGEMRGGVSPPVPPCAWLILRPKAVFGPGDTSLLPRLIAAARAGRLPIIGRGDNLIDLTYVGNVADAVALGVESSLSGRIYHITNGEHVPLWPLVARVLRHHGITPPTRRLPLWLAKAVATVSEWRATLFGGEPTLTRYTAAVLGTTQTYDITAARRDLGYEPRVSVEEGIALTLSEG